MNELLLNNDLTLLNNYLQHSGRPGMKWGTFGASGATRYQNHAVYAKGAPKTDTVKKPDKDRREVNTNKAPAVLLSLGLGTTGILLGDPLTKAVSSVTVAVNGKRAFDHLMAKRAEKLNNIRIDSLKVDKKTGFHLKDKEFSPDEDMKNVNPAYKDFNSNTKNNCAACTLAYELRRRGYDVQAEKAGYGFDREEMKAMYQNGKFKHIEKSNTKDNYASKVISELSKEKDGSRGNFIIWWGENAGHSIVYEIQNGNPIFRDCQSSKVYNELFQSR